MNQRQTIFIEHYLTTGQATESAKAAGYSDKTAYSQGARLLKKPEIIKTIELRRGEAKDNTELKLSQIVADVLKIAKVDIRKLFDEDGILKNMAALDNDTAFAVSEYSETTFKGRITRKVKLHSKQTAQDMLIKIIGGYATVYTLMQKMDDEQLNDLANRVLKQAQNERKQ